MALELEYRNTFIDVKQEIQDEMPASRNRAHSSPPGRVRRSSFAREMNDDEAAMRIYVGGLAQNAWPCRVSQISNTVAEDPPPSPVCAVAGVPHLLQAADAAGSCLVWVAGVTPTCAVARAFTSFPATARMVRIVLTVTSCTQRRWPSSTRGSVLCFNSSATRSWYRWCSLSASRKAEDGGYADEAEEILDLLEMGLDHATSSSESWPLADRELRNLRKTLARMSFSSLIGLISRTSHDEDEDSSLYAASLVAALQTLRSIQTRFQ